MSDISSVYLGKISQRPLMPHQVEKPIHKSSMQ